MVQRDLHYDDESESFRRVRHLFWVIGGSLLTYALTLMIQCKRHSKMSFCEERQPYRGRGSNIQYLEHTVPLPGRNLEDWLHT